MDRWMEAREKLHPSLHHLPFNEFLCIYLRIFEGRSFRYVADVLECSETTARRVHDSAMRRLADAAGRL